MLVSWYIKITSKMLLYLYTTLFFHEILLNQDIFWPQILDYLVAMLFFFKMHHEWRKSEQN